MVTRELIERLRQARSKMSADVWQRVSADVAHGIGAPTPETIRQVTDSVVNRDAAWILAEAFEASAGVTWPEIACVMATIAVLVVDGAPLTEIIWTGPANDRFPVRRIDQVLYDLISTARRRVLLVTFAAHRVPHLCQHLKQAVERGVEVSLVVESEEESAGQLTLDAMTAFQGIPLSRVKVYHWPIEMRERNKAGRPGKLHAKCAIIDDAALIGSANLTDDAFNLNMELGMLVRENNTVRAIATHFEELVSSGILIEMQRR